MNDEKYIKATTKNLYLNRPFKSTIAKINKIADQRGMTRGSAKAEYKKGLAAWLTGHRQGVSQHQWATARIKKANPSDSWSVIKKSKSKK